MYCISAQPLPKPSDKMSSSQAPCTLHEQLMHLCWRPEGTFPSRPTRSVIASLTKPCNVRTALCARLLHRRSSKMTELPKLSCTPVKPECMEPCDSILAGVLAVASYRSKACSADVLTHTRHARVCCGNGHGLSRPTGMVLRQSATGEQARQSTLCV